MNLGDWTNAHGSFDRATHHRRWSICRGRLPLVTVIVCALLSMCEACQGPWLYQWTPAVRKFHNEFYALPVRLAGAAEGVVIDDVGMLHRVKLETGAQGWAYLPISPASRFDPAAAPWRRTTIDAALHIADSDSDSDSPSGKRWRRALAGVSSGNYRVVLFPVRMLKGLLPPGILDEGWTSAAASSPGLEPWTSVFLKGPQFEVFPASGGETDARAAVGARKVAFFVDPNVRNKTLWPFDMKALEKTDAASGAGEVLGYALETISENSVASETGALRIGGSFFHYFTAPPLRDRLEAIVGSPKEEKFWRDADRITRKVQIDIFATSASDTFSINLYKEDGDLEDAKIMSATATDTFAEFEQTFPTSRGSRTVTFFMTRPLNEGWKITDFRARE